MTQQIAEIMGTILAIAFIIAFILAAIYLIIWSFKLEKERKNYLDTLTDEQKLVVLKYRELSNHVKVFERKQK